MCTKKYRSASVSSSGKFLFLFLRTQLLVTYFSQPLELLRLGGMFVCQPFFQIIDTIFPQLNYGIKKMKLFQADT